MTYFCYRRFCWRWWKELFSFPSYALRTLWRCVSVYYPPLFDSGCACCYSTGLRLLRAQLEEQRKAMAVHPIQPGGIERDMERIHLCELLLDRIIAEEYGLDCEDTGWKPRLYAGKAWYSEYMVQQDVRLLFQTLGRYIRHWWI